MTLGARPVDVYTAALAAPPHARRATRMRARSGRLGTVDLDRWLGPADAADADVLSRAGGLVLDVGCGPGRHVAALRERSVDAIGIDIAAGAVALARSRGARAVHRSVFEPLPAVWDAVLLLDGNIGIGGDPMALLRRARSLLAPGGRILVELDAPGVTSRRITMRLEHAGVASAWFPWAQLSVADIADTAGAVGLTIAESWDADGSRWFACLHA